MLPALVFTVQYCKGHALFKPPFAWPPSIYSPKCKPWAMHLPLGVPVHCRGIARGAPSSVLDMVGRLLIPVVRVTRPLQCYSLPVVGCKPLAQWWKQSITVTVTSPTYLLASGSFSSLKKVLAKLIENCECYELISSWKKKKRNGMKSVRVHDSVYQLQKETF